MGAEAIGPPPQRMQVWDSVMGILSNDADLDREWTQLRCARACSCLSNSGRILHARLVPDRPRHDPFSLRKHVHGGRVLRCNSATGLGPGLMISIVLGRLDQPVTPGDDPHAVVARDRWVRDWPTDFRSRQASAPAKHTPILSFTLVMLVRGVASEALREIITGFLDEVRFE
jgi:hypothetical protein